MSLTDEWPTRLRWYNGAGFVRTQAVYMSLTVPPYLGRDIDFVELDYAPGIVQQIRRRVDQPLDDLNDLELRACNAYLFALSDPPV